VHQRRRQLEGGGPRPGIIRGWVARTSPLSAENSWSTAARRGQVSGSCCTLIFEGTASATTRPSGSVTRHRVRSSERATSASRRRACVSSLYASIDSRLTESVFTSDRTCSPRHRASCCRCVRSVHHDDAAIVESRMAAAMMPTDATVDSPCPIHRAKRRENDGAAAVPAAVAAAPGAGWAADAAPATSPAAGAGAPAGAASAAVATAGAVLAAVLAVCSKPMVLHPFGRSTSVGVFNRYRPPPTRLEQASTCASAARAFRARRKRSQPPPRPTAVSARQPRAYRTARMLTPLNDNVMCGACFPARRAPWCAPTSAGARSRRERGLDRRV